MDTAVVQQFLNFFQDYINLCQLENWPDNDTSEAEIRNTFLISQHVEKSLDRLQKRHVIEEFISVLISYNDTPNNDLKNCLTDPPKYILKKIINSNTKINQMDDSFRLFLELFSEDKLEKCLTELILEAASKDTLLNNITKELSKERIQEFKSKVLLLQLSSCQSDILDLLSNCTQDFIELLVISLLNNEPKYSTAVKLIVDGVLNIVLKKDNTSKRFWRSLFKVDVKYFTEMCIENPDIFTYIVEALADCGKLLREGLSSESFYIDLNYSELVGVVQRICSHDSLKWQFFHIVKDYDCELEYWQNLL